VNEHTNFVELGQIGVLVNAALRILSMRLITLLALLMTFGLFCWAMAIGQPLHFAIAGAFGVIIFLPILFVGKPGVSSANT
jgi:hypothetical protein